MAAEWPSVPAAVCPVTQQGTETESVTGTMTVFETVTNDGGDDVLEFGAGIVAADILLQTEGDDLLVGKKSGNG